jgi:hypothetical protein
MGFGYTAAAGRMMGGIEAACAATRPDSETAANVFFANGKRYFHEVAAHEGSAGGRGVHPRGESGRQLRAG